MHCHSFVANEQPTVAAYEHSERLNDEWPWVDLVVKAGASTTFLNLVLERSLANHLRSRSFDVRVSRHGISAFPPHRQTASELDIRPGVDIYAFRADAASG